MADVGDSGFRQGPIVMLVRKSVLLYKKTGASSVSILRAMLCWFVQLFPKYGRLKLSQYDRNLQTRHRRYDRNCPGAMVVTVEKWS